MYNDLFDKELIEYLTSFFQNNYTESVEVTSLLIGDGLYEIRFENQHIVLQLLYEKACDDCEAQIRITNILLSGSMRHIGLSKKLLNALYRYCRAHGDMSLWIFDLVNRSWCDYLAGHGAVIIRQESQFLGAVLFIENEIQ